MCKVSLGLVCPRLGKAAMMAPGPRVSGSLGGAAVVPVHTPALSLSLRTFDGMLAIARPGQWGHHWQRPGPGPSRALSTLGTCGADS
jgi:hypothetical protein